MDKKRRASTRVEWTWRCLGNGVADVIRTDRDGNRVSCTRVFGDFTDCATAKALAAKEEKENNEPSEH